MFGVFGFTYWGMGKWDRQGMNEKLFLVNLIDDE